MIRNLDKCNLYFAAHSLKQSRTLFYLIGLLLITSSFPSVISEVRQFTCNNASSYAVGSTFSSNLNRVMGDLLKNAPQTGYNTSSYGQSPNRVYGLFQCIGNNVPPDDCSICAQGANNSIRQLCVNNIGGHEWWDSCFLRYENYSFFSKLDTQGDEREDSKVVVTNNISNFKTATLNLLSYLSDQAYDPANNGFNQGSFVYDSNITIYGQVQCLRDLYMKDCRSCLESARNDIHQCCSLKQGGQALLGSCTVHYGIYPIFNITGGSSTSPPPPSGWSGANPPTGVLGTPPANGTSSNFYTISISSYVSVRFGSFGIIKQYI